MTRWFSTLALASMLSVPLAAHFTFIVPLPDTNLALVVLSEKPEPDREVDVSLIAGTTLSFRQLDGKERTLKLMKGGEHAFGVELPKGARGVIHGLTDLGVNTREGAIPNILLYHPKTIIGDPFEPRTRLGDLAAAELVPVGNPRAFRLRLLGRGKPQAGAEVTVIHPDGSSRVAKTEATGETEVFTTPGRYAAWARYWEKTPGERQGKAYEEVRHYATIVFEVEAGRTSARASGEAPYARLPEASSSFGAVESEGWLYIYGGHIVPTHSYSTAAVSGRFSRMRLSDKTWEQLPGGPPLQGLNLVAHKGKIYRVGGMQPQNKAGEPEDIRSVASVARFDPASRRWEEIAPLQTPRSSHDVVIVDDTIVVIGGWTLRGTSGSDWATTMEVLNLAAPTLEWKAVPQPFQRRALIAAALNGKMYVLGGLDPKAHVMNATEIFDVKRNAWSTGPALPGGEMGGFGPAAAVLDRRLLVSLGDGELYRLTSAGDRWELIGQSTPRSVHRLVVDGRRALVIGGATDGDNSDLIESIMVNR